MMTLFKTNITARNRVFLYTCVIFVQLLMAVQVFAHEVEEEKIIVETYLNSDNSIVRKKILQTLSDEIPGKEIVVKPWKVSLLNTALNDKSPIVVEEAVRQIGILRLNEFNSSIIDVYNHAQAMFQGYATRVRAVILETLGRTGGKNAIRFIEKVLDEENGSGLTEYALAAVIELNDPSMLKAVQTFAQKMDTNLVKAKAKGVSPVFYSPFLIYSKQAKEIALLLEKKRGTQ